MPEWRLDMSTKSSKGRKSVRPLFFRICLLTICCLVLALVAIPVTRFHLLNSALASSPGRTTIGVTNVSRGLAFTVLTPETVSFQGSYSDDPNPKGCGPRHSFTVPTGKVRILVAATADIPTNDIVLKLYGPGGSELSSNDTLTSPETATYEPAGGVPPGTYQVEVCPFDDPSAPPTAPYSYSGTFTTDDTAAGPALGDGAGEPSIGYNPNTKRAMYIAGLQTLQVTFPENIQPLGSIPESGPADWRDVSFLTTRTRSLDPILFTDQGSGRTFVSQLNDIYQVYGVTGNGLTLIGLNSLMAYTDDDGASWTPAQVNPPDGSYDHQTVGGGPYPAILSALANPVNKGRAVYYCAQAGLTAYCSRGDDGGLNFGKSVPIYTAVTSPAGTGCVGIHGHVKVAPDGTVYIPNFSCGGKQSIVVSTDGGTTWAIRQIPDSLAPVSGILDPSLGISNAPPEAGATSNTIYFSYVGKQPGTVPTAEQQDNHIYVAVSRDRGLTWDKSTDVGILAGVKNAVFPAVVAGDANRAAVAFIGTSTSGDHQAADFKGTWYGYVAHTYDGGRTWTTVNATPAGPVQREACIWNGGGSNPCRNLLDFVDATVDDKGHVLFAFADGCIDGCETGGPNSYSSKASIARQSGGRGLFAQFDTPEPVVAKSPYLTGYRDDMASYLTWNSPDSGGSGITVYKIYRRSSSGGAETLIGQTSAKATSFNDRNVDTSVTSYTYRITAVNGVGEGASSNSISLVVEPRREATGACQAPGVTVVSDPAADESDAQTSHDITSVSIAEPQDQSGKIVTP